MEFNIRKEIIVYLDYHSKVSDGELILDLEVMKIMQILQIFSQYLIKK